MIRVLHVLSELRSSGAEVAMKVAGELWEHSGFDCDILSTAESVGPYADTLRHAGYRIHHLPFTGDLRFLRRYAALIRSERYDVVHIHMERASFYTAVTARIAGARTVRTVRNSFFFEGGLRRRRRLQRFLSRLLGTRFVAISDSVAQTEWDRFRNPSERIENWIDLTRFRAPSTKERGDARAALGINADALAVVTVGNCSSIKNHRALLQALAHVEQHNWVWIHVGAEDDARSEQALARQLDVYSSCRFCGRSDPLMALHAADLYVMPSLYEGLGMATVEALSTGLPALLTDVPGNRDLAGVSSRVFWATPDVPDLARGLAQALAVAASSDPYEGVTEQQAAIAARYSPQRGVSDYAALYRDILGPRVK